MEGTNEVREIVAIHEPSISGYDIRFINEKRWQLGSKEVPFTEYETEKKNLETKYGVKVSEVTSEMWFGKDED